MHSDQIKSQTATIIANLETKISKYLSPTYETCDIFDKSRAITKTHQEFINQNKQFHKKNSFDQFYNTEVQIESTQFDQLLNRRRKCQAKLQSMLFDHKIEECLSLQFSLPKSPLSSSLKKMNEKRASKLQVDKEVLESLFIAKFYKIIKLIIKHSKKVIKFQQRKQIKENLQQQNQLNKVFYQYKKQKKQLKILISQIQIQLIFQVKIMLIKKKYLKIKSNSQKSLRQQHLQQNIQPNKQPNMQPNQLFITHSNQQTSFLPNSIKHKHKLHKKNPLNDCKLKKIGFQDYNSRSKKIMEKCQNLKDKSNLNPKTSIDQKKEETAKNKFFHQSQIKMNILKCQSEKLF